MSSQSLADLCSARVGTTIKGKWRLDRVIGIGGMAAVYEATHKIGRKEAIKMLHPEIARSPDLCARFEQEARATNKLSHPGAVQIRDIDSADDGCPFLVMELLEGENLGDRAARLGGIEEGDMLRYVDELLDVLAAAHAAAIVHRDIKLENLFVTTDGKLKVLDFGIARMRSGPALTRTGMRLGTTSYMSPEQVRGKEVDGRADVFAVGATMFRLIARRRIHEAETDAELVAKMAAEPAPPLASVAKVSPEVAMVVDRALAFDVADRYPSATAMQSDVASLRRGEAPEFAMSRLVPPAPASMQPQSMQPQSMQPQSLSSFAMTTERTTLEGATQRAGAPLGMVQVTTPAQPLAYGHGPQSQHAPLSQHAPQSQHVHVQHAPQVHPPQSWNPASTFAATAPQAMGGLPQAAQPYGSVPPRAEPKSNAGLIAGILLAGICVVGGVGFALYAYTPSSNANNKSAARGHDDDDDDTRKGSGKRKKANDDESPPKPEAAADGATKNAQSAIVAPSAAATASSVVTTTPAKTQPGANRASPAASLPGLGVAFPTTAPSAKQPPGLSRPGDVFGTPK